MNCLVCQKNLDDFVPVCADHVPALGKWLLIGRLAVIAGELGIRDAVIMKLARKYLIRWWVGTDVLLLHKFPPGRGKLSVMLHRLKSRILDLMVDEHWIDGYRLFDEFKGVRPRLSSSLKLWVGKHVKYEKEKHDGINIAYYDPAPSIFAGWKYGIDLIEKIVTMFPQVNWISLDGSLDMTKIYPILDGMIRSSRHDGFPRIVDECRLNLIPYYYSEDGIPDLEAMTKFVEGLLADAAS